MNYKTIKYMLGWILLFEAVFLALPAITAVIYREKALFSILITMGLCLLLGLLLTLNKPKDKTIYSKEGFVIVSLSWIILSLFGALPFVISGEIPSYVDAFFETVSGFTTTGSSILPEVEDMSKSLLMWRSFTHWIGGMGVLVFIMAFLPLSGGRNMHMMKAESPGPSVEKLVPRVRTTALILYAIYFIMTVVMLIVLLFGGMSLFDALNTAFATAGTGGFGIKADSLGSYSAFLQVTVTVFMLLFSINFGSYYLAFKCRFKDAFNTEIRTFLLIVFSAVAIITANLLLTSNISFTFGSALKESAFAVASIISTSGFAISDFNLWPELSKGILVLLMFVGACAGSTGGGIKVSRIVLLAKCVRRELHRLIHPREVRVIKVDGKPQDSEMVHTVCVYVSCYALLFTASMLIISLDNFSFTTNFTAVAATINNVGPGLDIVGPASSFAAFSPLSKIVLSFTMLAGRLELFPMLLLFMPATWKKI